METRKPSTKMCHSAGRVTAKLLFSWLAASAISTQASASWADGLLNEANQVHFAPSPPPSYHQPQALSPLPNQEHEFSLRHIFDHGLYGYQHRHRRLDIYPNDTVWITADGQNDKVPLGPLRAKSARIQIERLFDRRVSTMQSMYHTARLTGSAAALDASAWTIDEVSAPNTTDKETVLALARMSWDAYTAEPGTGDWQDATGKFNDSQGFGWEGDSLRGHIFADKDNSTIIVALKGTSPGRDYIQFSAPC